MAYQDIDRWKEMDKDQLYQELVKLYGDIPPIGDITHIYVNNCYELGAEVDGYASDYFVSLYPDSPPLKYQRVDASEDILPGFPGDVFVRGRNPHKIELRFSPCKSLDED